MSLTRYLSALLFLLASYSLVSYVAVAQPEATSTTADNETSIEPEPAAVSPVDQPFEDYEASEQISEDLSVAFPVDI
ncbi:MAG: hypothetical protein ACI8RN_001390 [Glaciecola sp.]|jgi:hypothetical protein|uniref:hypothetical protein n=1 Tax=Congregibacter sp. TaxID=2744308 RepID=UPI0039E6AB39